MKEKLKNAQMVDRLRSLETLLSHRDKIGYIAARNYRILSDSLTEYTAFKTSLIEKYGEVDKNEAGVETGTISLGFNSPNFKAFCDEMVPFNEIEHEVDLMIAKYEDAIGCLTGEELLRADWMFED